MLLIPKGNRDFIGIGIVEFLWKSLSGVINWHIRATVQFHDVLHVFWACRGIGENIPRSQDDSAADGYEEVGLIRILP